MTLLELLSWLRATLKADIQSSGRATGGLESDGGMRGKVGETQVRTSLAAETAPSDS